MNIGICAVLLKAFCAPYISTLEEEYPTPEDKLEAVRNLASDQGNDEIVTIVDWIEKAGLTTTFFPEVEVCDCEEVSGEFGYIEKNVCSIHAKLVAQAPAMLEALIEAEAVIGRYDAGGTVHGIIVDAIKKATNR